ncbi:MAG: PilZ domain-containing protein [Planctomycetota bacterium]
MAGRLLSQEFTDTTGYSDAQWATLAGHLGHHFRDEHLDSPADHHARQSMRFASPTALPLYVLFRDENRDWMPYTVHCRDLSEHGIGVYHGLDVPADTRCYVLFKEFGKSDKLLGRVRYTAPLVGRVHLVGIEFDQPIDLGRYLPLLQGGPQRDAVSESVVGMVFQEQNAGA